MCKSRAYSNLSIGAKHFYTLCRVQAKSTQGTSCLYKHSSEYGVVYNQYCFVFPSSHLALYGVDRSNACKYFKELETAGFIRKVEGNKQRKKVNVYEFSDEWKNSS